MRRASASATATVARGVVVGILFYGVEITTPVLVVLPSRDEIAARGSDC
jgi:hypothetical protein